MTWHKEQQGFVTFAQNTATVDYLRLAYLQALSIKATQKVNRFAVIVDQATNNTVTNLHKKVFDYVIVLENDYNTDNYKFGNEHQVFALTPFKETVKVESDLLFTDSIDHWWPAFRKRDIVLSWGCLDWQQQHSSVRAYRKFFDDNCLPDVYNGLMYFRFSQTASDFFRVAKKVQDNWPMIREHALVNCREDNPSTDVLYAVTAELLGRELCTMPTMDFIKFTHMKPAINSWYDDWPTAVITELDNTDIRINNLNQYAPLHYQTKEFATDELIEHYERILK
jgi:hypothetical protein